MIVYAQESLAHSHQNSIIGAAIAAICLIATVAFLIILFRDLRRILQPLVQTAVYALQGEKSPESQRRKQMKQMRERVFSREEAIVRVRQYAEANGWSAQDPFDVRLRFVQATEKTKEGSSVGRFVYSIKIGSSRPGTVVEVDATDGTVLAWRTFPR
jgi:hypothetical protein